MLTTVRIKNLALVEDLTLELQPGYNAITGETGAGKSILIGALSLVLGDRADRTLVRSGSEVCAVEAVFDARKLKVPVADRAEDSLERSLDAWLEINGLEPCSDGQLVLKRTITVSGTNRQFVNGSPTTLNILAALGASLVDFHGPHEHQSLLHPARQLDILDAFGKLESEREAVASLCVRRAALQREVADLVIDEKTYAQQVDLLRHQATEIEAARLLPEEEEQLTQDYHRSSNAARLQQLAQTGLDLLAESDSSLLTQAGGLGRTFLELHRVDSSAADLVSQHEAVVGQLNDLQNALSHYLDRIEVDPARLQELEDRLNLIQSLKRKYGSNLAEVVAFGVEVRRKLQTLEQRDAELARINAEMRKTETQLAERAAQLSTKRRKILPQLAKAVNRQLADLGFKQSRFEVGLSQEPSGKPSQTGLDTADFLFSPNPGEPPKPLRAIASSGELARVMLALKTVLAAEDQVPVLVFDEVDANVGGETAHAVGDKMQQVARTRQVLCITHLPQVAAPASAHYLVSKETKGGRTISQITLLDPEGRITELARMLGGQSQASRKHAQELLDRRA